MGKTMNDNAQESERFKRGAVLYRRFVLMPEKYKDNTVFLRVLMRGKFGGWKLRSALLNAFGMEAGNVLFLNNVVGIGINASDIDEDSMNIDCIAEGEAAEWILENEITTGTVFEGEFILRYELVKNVAGVKGSSKSEDAKIAMLVLKKGIAVIEKREIVEEDDLLGRDIMEILKRMKDSTN